MPSLNQNIICYAGNSVQVTIQLRQIPVTFNMTGASASWAMGGDPNAAAPATAVVTKTSAAGDIVLKKVGTGYVLSFTLAGEDTADLEPGTFYHEAQVTTVSGDKATISSGRVFVKPVLIK